jgi:hypothetical protein
MGPYDNEGDDGRGCYVESPDWENGQWLVDEEGVLYILPIDGDQVEGPDGELVDRILATLRASGSDVLSEDEMAALGVQEISRVLKRFSADTGYYSA